MTYIKLFPTISDQFRTRQTDWRDRREQATPVLNKILGDLEKKENWTQQRSFLMRCRDSGIVPKGLRVTVPKGIMSREQEKKWKIKCEIELIQKTVKRLFVKQQSADERIAKLKLQLRNKFKMGEKWIENTMRWLEKKAKGKAESKKTSLKGKFDKLNAEKKMIEELFEENKMKYAEEKENTNPMKKIVYNNSSKTISRRQQKVLELGLTFAITPKKFPLLEYIAATENLCQSLEECGDDESIEKAQTIRNIVLNHIRKGVGMKIKENLSAEDTKILQDLMSDTSIIICPADKGKAIVIEDKDTYLAKMQQQIDEGDYKLEKRKEKTLLDKLHKKLLNQLKNMKIDMNDFKEKRKYLVSAPVLGHMYLLIKVHKKNFPGRAVVSQIDDPTYKICKILTDILNPLAEKGDSYIQNSYDLKKTLAGLKIDENDIQASFDVVALYPSIPVEKALCCVREKLMQDESLADRTEWKVEDIMKLLTICLETHFKTIDGRIYTQIDGTPIGKSISGPLADIFMIWFEEQYIFNEKNVFKPYIKLWKRSRDDIYILSSGDQKHRIVFSGSLITKKLELSSQLKEKAIVF